MHVLNSYVKSSKNQVTRPFVGGNKYTIIMMGQIFLFKTLKEKMLNFKCL